MKAVCYCFPDASAFGARLTDALGAARGELDIHRFPDGESRVRLVTPCDGASVVLVQSGRNVDQGALPLYFAAHAARAMGASSVGLVSPYLPYMRQDLQFRDGEAVSALAYARFLSSCIDWVATVDPHLHRIHSLDDIFAVTTLCISAMPEVARWIGENVASPIILGPDEESRQWVQPVARALGAPWATLVKQRSGDRSVSVTLPDAPLLAGRTPVIVDDIASSGHTLAEAAAALRQAGSLPPTCVVVHALLEPGAEQALRAAGVNRLVSTNTLCHATNEIDTVPAVAARIRGMHEGVERTSDAFAADELSGPAPPGTHVTD